MQATQKSCRWTEASRRTPILQEQVAPSCHTGVADLLYSQTIAICFLPQNSLEDHTCARPCESRLRMSACTKHHHHSCTIQCRCLPYHGNCKPVRHCAASGSPACKWECSALYSTFSPAPTQQPASSAYCRCLRCRVHVRSIQLATGCADLVSGVQGIDAGYGGHISRQHGPQLVAVQVPCDGAAGAAHQPRHVRLEAPPAGLGIAEMCVSSFVIIQPLDRQLHDSATMHRTALVTA